MEKEGIIEGDIARARVAYCRKHGLPGRRYAKGPSLQMLTKEARGVAMNFTYEDSYVVDIDIRNAHPTLLMNMLKDVSPELHSSCTAWSAYNANVDEWRGMMSDLLDIPVTEAKTHLVKLFYLARPARDIPPLLETCL